MTDAREPGVTPRPIVGRSAEFSDLVDGVHRAAKGQMSLVGLTGEPGIGKTRLAKEVLQAAAGVAQCFAGTAYAAEPSPPLSIWVEAFEPYIATLDSVAAARGMFGATNILRRLFPTVQTAVADAPDPPDFRMEQEAQRDNAVFASFRDLMAAVSRATPIVVLLDDIQYADRTSIELLHYLGRHMEGTRVLIIATYRKEARAPRFELASCVRSLERHGFLREVELGPLSVTETRELAQAMVGSATIPSQTVEVLHERSGGNPFHLSAILADFEQHEIEHWAFGTEFHAKVPRSVQDLVADQIDSLSPNAQEVIRLVAVAGEAADWSLVEASAGLPDTQVLLALEELLDRQLLSERLDRGRVTYAFNHPLVQESVYGTLGPSRQAHLHGRIGRVLEERTESPAPTATQLAWHLSLADRQDTRKRALPHLIAASEQALALFANFDAIRLLEGCLSVLDASDSNATRRLVLQRLGEALNNVGRVTEAIHAWNEALGHSTAPADRARLHRLLGRASWEAGFEAQAIEHLEAGLRALGPTSDSGEAADLRQELAQAHQRLGDGSRAIADATAAARMAQAVGAPEIEAASKLVLLVTHGVMGDIQRAFSFGEEILAIAERHNLISAAWQTHATVGALARFRGDVALVERHLRASLEVLGLMHAPGLKSWPLLMLAELEFATGRWAAAEQTANQALAIDRYFEHGMLPRSLAFLAALHRLTGRETEARVELEEACSVLASLHKNEVRVWWSVNQVQVLFLFLDGDFSASVDQAREIIAFLDERGFVHYMLQPMALPLVAEAALKAGDISMAARFVERLAQLSSSANHLSGRAWTARLRALLMEEEGDEQGALSLLREARALAEESGHLYDVARTRLDLARIQLTLQMPGGADEAAAALAAFLRMGAVHDQRTARRLMRDHGLRAMVPRVRRNQEELSKRETEVGSLIAQGLSNREIGERLFISVHTVESHVRNVLSRLDLKSRAEFAVVATQKHRQVGETNGREQRMRDHAERQNPSAPPGLRPAL